MGIAPPRTLYLVRAQVFKISSWNKHICRYKREKFEHLQSSIINAMESVVSHRIYTGGVVEWKRRRNVHVFHAYAESRGRSPRRFEFGCRLLSGKVSMVPFLPVRMRKLILGHSRPIRGRVPRAVPKTLPDRVQPSTAGPWERKKKNLECFILLRLSNTYNFTHPLVSLRTAHSGPAAARSPPLFP